MQNWYKLDNAGKVYPSLYNPNNTNVFRLSALFFEEIDGALLQDALEITLQRYKTFNVKLRKGLFWYYLEPNSKKAFVKEESPYIFQSIHKDNNNFLFAVSYFGKRINVEIFHALTDATGGAEFLKTLCYNYLKFKNINIENDGSLITSECSVSPSEAQDSFVATFKDNVEALAQCPKAYILKGHKCPKYRVEIINGMMDVSELKSISKKYDCTITAYLCGVLIYSYYINTKENNSKKLPITALIPINARKILGTKTLRNFMLYIRSGVNFEEGITVDDCIKAVRDTLTNELTEEYLQSVLKLNVPVERNMLIRLTPLFMKKIGIRFMFKLVGTRTTSTCFSNLGEVKMPEAMSNYIDRIEFVIAPSPSLPIMTSAISYNNKFIFSFVKSIRERAILKTFFSIVSNDVKVIIYSNDLGGA